jgi:hypothetical protein
MRHPVRIILQQSHSTSHNNGQLNYGLLQHLDSFGAFIEFLAILKQFADNHKSLPFPQ